MASADVIGASALHPSVNNMASGFAKMCRTCAACTDSLMPIFTGEGLLNNLADKIHRHLPIRVSEQDRLPQQLCHQCSSTLLAWHELVKCCTQADAALRVRLQRLQEQAHQENGASVKHKVATAAAQPAPVREQEPICEQEHKYRCAHCAAAFTQQALYRDHLASVHIDTLFHCRECDGYENRDNLVPHMSHHAEQYDAGEFSDPDADFVLPDAVLSAIEEPNELDVSNATLERPEKVGLPNEKASLGDRVDGEVRAIKEKRKNLEKIDSEKVEKSKPQFRASCGICGKEFRASSSYFYHKKFVHAARTERKHECAVCGLRCATSAALREHDATHTDARPHACRRCAKTFRSKAGLYIHTRDVHASPDENKFTCAHCGMSFRWRKRLVIHMKRHWNQRPNVCDVCGASFTARCDLTRHARTHGATQRTHACTLCGASFAQPRYLRDHARKKHPTRVTTAATQMTTEQIDQTPPPTVHTQIATALSLLSPSQSLITISTLK